MRTREYLTEAEVGRLAESAKGTRDRSPARANLLQRRRPHYMQRTIILWLCLSLGACSSVSETAPPDVVPQPDQPNVLTGIKAAINDSHFAPPIEVTDLISAPPSSSSPWMVCIRSASSEESKRITYSAFFKSEYISSRYSAIFDGCAANQYHPFNDQPIPNVAAPKNIAESKAHGGQK
jgi:hypothetical protein